MIRRAAPVWCRSLGNYAASTQQRLAGTVDFKTPRWLNPNFAGRERHAVSLPPPRRGA